MKHCSHLLLVGLSLMFIAIPASGTHIVITGDGGNEQYRAKFNDWSTRLRTQLVNFGYDPSEVFVFQESEDETRPAWVKPADLDSLTRFFEVLAKTHNGTRDLFIYLIGHGSYLRGEAKFQIPGPDLSAKTMADLIAKVPARNTVVVNMASASAGFINALSGKNRVICSATKNVREQYATEFAEFFIQSLERGDADRNRDGRISVWEACEQAAASTGAWYLSEKLIATEHAILDDNGDGLGTRLYTDPDEPARAAENADALDGELAHRCFIKDFSFPDKVPKALIKRYVSQIEKVERLKTRKHTLNADAYYRQLEQYLIEAAKLHREIRRLGKGS